VKKAPALISLAIIASTVALTFYLSQRSEQKAANAWQLVTPSSIGVFETSKPQALARLKTDTSGFLDMVVARAKGKSFNEPWLFSFQSTGKEVGWIVLLPKGFPSLLDTLEKAKYKINKRAYEGKTIYDAYRGTRVWASITQLDGIWIASPHAILVEAAIRQGQTRDRNFKSHHATLFGLPAVKQDDGNFYLGNVTAMQRSASAARGALPLSHSMILDLRWSDQTLMGNGFAFDTVQSPTLLSLFAGQQPVTLDLRKLIPDDARSVMHFGFSNAQLWFRDQKKTRVAVQVANIPETEQGGFDRETFAKAVDNEMLSCTMSDGSSIVLIEVKEITTSQTQLDKIRTQLAREGQYSRDNYADRIIHTLKKPAVLASLVWPFDISSAETSYTYDGNILVLASSVAAIEKFIDATDDERTAGKSLEWRRFFESTLTEANVSYLENNESGEFTGRQVGLPQLMPVEKMSFQFYSVEGKYYASGSMLFGDLPQAREARRATDKQLRLADRSLLRPSLVRNYLTRQNEVIVQDSANILRLIDPDGRTRWSVDIGARILTDVGELDYLKNGKIQFAFCTKGRFHIVDRLGKHVKGFPKEITMQEPRSMSVVDYDNNRNYRIMLADARGDILLTDKDGNALPGWSPRAIGRRFVDAPDFHRISGRDYFVAMTIDGNLHLFNRRGEHAAGFPIETKLNPSGAVVCDGKLISFVSELGVLVKYDHHGKRVMEEPLSKNIVEAAFQLVALEDESDFIVIRIERGNLAVFDSSGKQRFEIVNPLSDKIEVQYITTGGDKAAVVVRDMEQNLLFTTDMSGQLLIHQPVQATQAPVADYDRESRTLRLFVVNGDKFEIMKLPI
jgi:hypothetical protein